MKNYIITQGYKDNKKIRSYWTMRKPIGGYDSGSLEYEKLEDTLTRIKKQLKTNEYLDTLKFINAETKEIILEEKLK